MVRQVYSIQDVKVSVFHPPMVLKNKAEARRLMADVVADSQTPMHKYPEDFRLMHIGEFDDNSGLLSPLATPEFIADAIEFKSK